MTRTARRTEQPSSGRRATRPTRQTERCAERAIGRDGELLRRVDAAARGLPRPPAARLDQEFHGPRRPPDGRNRPAASRQLESAAARSALRWSASRSVIPIRRGTHTTPRDRRRAPRSIAPPWRTKVRVRVIERPARGCPCCSAAPRGAKAQDTNRRPRAWNTLVHVSPRSRRSGATANVSGALLEPRVARSLGLAPRAHGRPVRPCSTCRSATSISSKSADPRRVEHAASREQRVGLRPAQGQSTAIARFDAPRCAPPGRTRSPRAP